MKVGHRPSRGWPANRQGCQIMFLFSNTVTLSAYPTRSLERKDLLVPWYIICIIYSGWLFSCLPYLYIKLMKWQLMIEFCYSTKCQSWGIMKFRFVSPNLANPFPEERRGHSLIYYVSRICNISSTITRRMGLDSPFSLPVIWQYLGMGRR